jgi:phosphohistidine phosphatase
MKQLTLIRHATAAPAFAEQQDWDRELEASGVRDAHKMAKELRARKAKPNVFLSSPAVRTLATAEIIAREIGFPIDAIQRRERLYLAPPKDLLALARELGGAAQHLWMIGHNPGISEFADQLSGERHIDNMPTCAVVQMEFEIESWSNLAWGLGVNVQFDYPLKRR